ncbi:unnamed protein product [Protopolystoma xenopodis]|uniref:Uncharacterized protein n=1 Tax=Protopolystoma xenopodis TaxID=117903 RepID=A0A448XE27_9PLAT|nr:unnamed protein product [Protopolystoma xenopodis]
MAKHRDLCCLKCLVEVEVCCHRDVVFGHVGSSTEAAKLGEKRQQVHFNLLMGGQTDLRSRDGENLCRSSFHIHPWPRYSPGLFNSLSLLLPTLASSSPFTTKLPQT